MQYKHKQLSHLGSSVLLLPGVLGALELAAALQLLASRTDLRGPRPRSLSGESERADCGDSVPASEPGVGVSCCWPGLHYFLFISDIGMTVPLPREGTYYGLFHTILSRHCETSRRLVGSSSDDGYLGLRNMRGEWRMVR